MLDKLFETIFFCGGASVEDEPRNSVSLKAGRWTAVAITAPAVPVANAIASAVRGWLQASYGQYVLVVAAEAGPDTAGNSGGATLSALLAVAEALSVRKGCNVLANDALADERVLVLHCGSTDVSRPADGPQAAREVLRSVGRVLQMTTRLFHGGLAGVAIASTSSELLPSDLYSDLCPEDQMGDWLQLDAASAGTVIAVPCKRSEAAHRWVCVSAGGGLAGIVMGSALSGSGAAGNEEEEEDLLPVFDGLCWLGPRLLQALVPLLSAPPLDAATDAGKDTGTVPLPLDLAADVLGALLGAAVPEDFLRDPALPAPLRAARQLLWEKLRLPGCTLRLCVAPSGTAAIAPTAVPPSQEAVAIGSVAAGSVAPTPTFSVTARQPPPPPPLPAAVKERIAQLVAALKQPFQTPAPPPPPPVADDPAATAANADADADAPPAEAAEAAEVAPVAPAEGALAAAGDEAALWIAELAGGDEHCYAALLAALDKVAASAPLPLAARCFWAIAEALARRAGEEGGLRSGSAAHPVWKEAFALLEGEPTAEARAQAVKALAARRSAWAGAPRLQLRAARHYERAAALSIASCVAQRPDEHAAVEGRPLPLGSWVRCDAPARVDLAGGWSDTPPICYERGGVVIAAAVRVGGDLPIGARARRIAEPVIRLRNCAHPDADDASAPGTPVASEADADGASSSELLELASLEEVFDLSSPLAAAALPKAVLVASGVLSLSGAPLAEQLHEGGFEIVSWSKLPVGSGMGSSSILASALVAVVGRLLGRSYETPALTHAVLQVEQLLTSAGGWQDQAAALLPGIKRLSSAPSLPIAVSSAQIAISPEALAALSSRLQLVYTGSNRLARNLVQDVLRRWHGRSGATLANVDSLLHTADEMQAALESGDVAAAGACLGAYWTQKRRMCDAEPPRVTKLLTKLAPLVWGASLCGAGGGGFMVLITKEPNAAEAVEKALLGEGATLYPVAISTEGLSLTIE